MSSPSVVNGRVFVTVGASDELWALRASDGLTLWHRSTGGTSQLESPPAVADGRVFVQSFGMLSAFAARTGRHLWTRTDGGNAEEPVLANRLVYVTNGRIGSCCGAGLTAYRQRSGRRAWRLRSTGVAAMHAPAVVGGVAYTASTSATATGTSADTTLWALDALTGRTRWTRHPPLNQTTLPNGVDATPSVSDGVVYDGGLDAYSTTGERLWINSRPFGSTGVTPSVGEGFVINSLSEGDGSNGGACAYQVTTGRLAWCAVGDDEVYDPTTIANGVVYVDILGNFLAAYDVRTGRELFADDHHIVSGQPVVVAGTVYMGGYWRVFAYRQ